MALKLDVLANTRQFTSEMKKAGASTEDVSDALDDMAREGERGTDKLERSFRDLAQDAKRADKAVEGIGDSSKKGFKRAGGASSEFKDEALANFSEVTSSFDGSMQSVSDLAQGTLGGVASAIPGIGIAAGIAAAGIGAITANMVAAQEKAEEIKQSVIDDFLELGDALDKEAVDARVRDILGTKETMAQAKLLADLLDVTVGQAALAMAGDFESAGVSIEDVMSGIENASGNVDLNTWEALKGTIGATTEGMKAGREAAEAQAQAQRNTAATTKQAQKEQREAIAQTRNDLLAMARGTYSAKLNVDVNDRTSGQVDRIVRRINGKVASIQISAGVSGRQLL